MSHYEHEPSAAEFVAAPGERRDAPKTKIVNGETCVGDFARFGPEGWVQCPECLHVGPLEAATPPKADPALHEALLDAIQSAWFDEGPQFAIVRDAIMDKLTEFGLIAREGRE